MPDGLSLALRDAIARGDHPDVLRLARTRRGWSQTALAEQFGCHPSLISRFEGRRRPMRDVAILGRLAELLDLPPVAFGLHDRAASLHAPASASRVNGTSASEEDPLRRRTFLHTAVAFGGAVLTSAAPAVDRIDPAAVLAGRLADILVGRLAPEASPTAAPVIRSGLRAAQGEFSRAQYLELSQRLPELVTAAEATATASGDELVAQSYNLVTRAAFKLRTSGLEWISADRALRAATRAGQPLILAESERMMASVCRRAGHHERAQELVLAAADHLDLTGPRPDPRHLALHGMLLCTAGYGAARAGNRTHASDLLAEATTTTARLHDHPDTQQRLVANIASHQVSVAHVLGDPAAALRHAHTAAPVVFASIEREGRFLVDVALAYQALDEPEHAYATLREAERRAPGEVHTRSAARGLVSDLLIQHRVSLPGIRELAIRAHAA